MEEIEKIKTRQELIATILSTKRIMVDFLLIEAYGYEIAFFMAFLEELFRINMILGFSDGVWFEGSIVFLAENLNSSAKKIR